MGKQLGAEKLPRKVLIIGGAGWRNVGDDLIAQALQRWVSSTARRVKIVGGPYPVEGGKDRQIEIGGNLRTRLRLAWHIARADYVLIGGGGLLDDRASFFYRPFTRAAKVCQVLRTRYAFAGIGVGPIRSATSAEAYLRATQRAHAVYVRDSESRDRLAAAGLTRDVAIVPDPVLWDLDKRGCEPRAPRFDLAVNLRNWRSDDGHRNGYDGPTNGQIIEAVAQAINGRLGGIHKIALVSMSGHMEDDDATMLEQLRGLLRTKEVTTYYECAPAEAQEALEGAETILAMRLHACLVGVRSGRRVIGLAYDPKVTQQGLALGFTTIALDKNFAETGRDNMLEAFESAQTALQRFAVPPLPWH